MRSPSAPFTRSVWPPGARVCPCTSAAVPHPRVWVGGKGAPWTSGQRSEHLSTRVSKAKNGRDSLFVEFGHLPSLNPPRSNGPGSTIVPRHASRSRSAAEPHGTQTLSPLFRPVGHRSTIKSSAVPIVKGTFWSCGVSQGLFTDRPTLTVILYFVVSYTFYYYTILFGFYYRTRTNRLLTRCFHHHTLDSVLDLKNWKIHNV